MSDTAKATPVTRVNPNLLMERYLAFIIPPTTRKAGEGDSVIRVLFPGKFGLPRAGNRKRKLRKP